MNEDLAWLAVVAATIAGMNIAATVKVLVSDFYERRQKCVQAVLIWGLPVIGAILCYVLAQESDGPNSGKYAERPDVFKDFNDASSMDISHGHGGYDQSHH